MTFQINKVRFTDLILNPQDLLQAEYRALSLPTNLSL